MNTIVVSYSLTGNNQALAASVAKGLGAEHAALKERKKRTMGTTIVDLLLHRTPKTDPAAEVLAGYDAVVLAGPIWIGEIATPLRACMKRLQTMGCPYAFVSISGGADGPNVKLGDELARRIRRKPAALIDLHIADLLPAEPKPERKDTSAYQLTPEDVETLTKKALEQLQAFAREENTK